MLVIGFVICIAIAFAIVIFGAKTFLNNDKK